MLITNELQYSVPTMVSPSSDDHLELFRLLAAAVVNSSFRHLLLVDPQQAIENGYQGETFLLSDAERYLLLYLHADSLSELAQQITQALGVGLHTQSLSFAPAPDFIGY
jgi:hypothetical protein